MKILIADYFGMCFGVRDAIQQAKELASQAPLTILGELVHNPIVREDLKKHGAVEFANTVSTTQVMITAHGTSDREREKWRKAGLQIHDGTCPLVHHAHNQLRRLVEQGFFPVVIGQQGHVEVKGLIGDFSEAVVIENEMEMDKVPDVPRIGIISQTTQRIEFVRRLVGQFRALRPKAEIRFVDTVCKPTKDRQHALQELLRKVDVMIVVGGRNSNNTKQLVATACNAGVTSHHIESANDLKPAWFQGDETVGITAGTSTLKETVSEVHRRLLEISLTKTPCL